MLLHSTVQGTSGLAYIGMLTVLARDPIDDTVQCVGWDGYLDFASHHPLFHKKSVVRSLLSRAKALVHCDGE